MSTKKQLIDAHTKNALLVASNKFFVIKEASSNENPGLLIGTEVQKHSDPECVDSKYWDGLYWTVRVICPNGETRKVCCDVLQPRASDKAFNRQKKVFAQVA